MKKPNGYVVYEGASLIDGAPIVVIATGFANKTANAKTGDMIQTWIIRSDVKPNDAVKTGADVSVCGNCPHRPRNLGSCYVRVFQGPRAVYESYKKGNYPVIPKHNLEYMFAGHRVRLGSYGDPAAVPYEILSLLVKYSLTHTGYTHQWKENWFDKKTANVCMASVDNVEDFERAKKLAMRTFRVRSVNEPLLDKEVVCPASEEAGKIIDCATCGACKGSDTKQKSSIVIIAHGNTKKRFTEREIA